jgi:peptidoglycan L-alanyl-D-glutamate endopeptidase CwlK
MDEYSINMLSKCHPLLIHLITAMAGSLEAQEIEIRVIQGLRSYADQNLLYAQGRTAPGPIVTNAPGGYSNHNFGMAADCIPYKVWGQPWQPDWEGTDLHYQAMISAGRTQGLICGADWHTLPDRPHFQLDIMPVTPSMQMRADFEKGGLALVWAEADKGVYMPAE